MVVPELRGRGALENTLWPLRLTTMLWAPSTTRPSVVLHGPTSAVRVTLVVMVCPQVGLAAAAEPTRTVPSAPSVSAEAPLTMRTKRLIDGPTFPRGLDGPSAC